MNITTYIYLMFTLLSACLIMFILCRVRQAKQLKQLNNSLEQTVSDQVLEIRKTCDSEKKAKRELEKLNEAKDQFIMITQHHLRSPVTSIKCQLEALLSGESGRISRQVAIKLKYMDSSVNRLGKIVDDFLSITTLKAGAGILNITRSSLLPIIVDILNELKVDIENKNIAVNYSLDRSDWPEIHIDEFKIRDALLIVLENAVRYNKESGKIYLQTISDGNTFELSIFDTGIGISSEDLEKISGHHFHRSEEARKFNPVGMGIGLSVARAMIQAHHGILAIESKGGDSGTTVYMKFPLLEPQF